MADERFNTELAVDAEQTRQARDGDVASGILRVKALAPVVLGDNQAHKPGSTFQASEASVEQAIARGLVEKVAPRQVEKVEAKAKR